MASTFTRLYRYAKAVGAEAKENYTTEALRAAIESDPRPMLDALGIAVAPGAGVKVRTQHAVEGVGIVDMVLTLVEPAASRAVWIEVKVDAGESGNQLTRYSDYIRAIAEPSRPRLVVLGPKPLALGEHVTWQRLRDAIRSSKTTSPYWLDFKKFLEEIRMADDFDEAVTGTEASALLPARSLVGKVGRILNAFAGNANKVRRGSAWPEGEDEVTAKLLTSLKRRGTLTIGSESLRGHGGVSAGVTVPVSSDGEVRLGLWIWMNPKRVAERHQLLAKARDSVSGAEWVRDEAEWELLGAYRTLADVGSHAEAAAWLVARLTELRDAALLDVFGDGAGGLGS